MQPKRKHLGAFSRGLLAAAIAIGVVAVVGVVLTTSSHSLAQPFTTFTIEDLGTSIGLGTADLKQTIVNIIRWVLGILALVAVSFIIYGGFLWMTARGDENRILKAKKVIAGAVIGLIIVLLSFAIVTFVAGTTSNVTNPGGGPGGVTPPPPPPATSFEIRSITTACGSPPNYRQDVFLCSGIVITFNHRVNAASVQAAVAAAGDDQLIIERCSDAGCSSATTVAPGIASQIYGGTSPTGVSAEWVTPTLGSQPGKSIVFYHKHELFEPDTYYRVRIPKAITDTSTPAQPIEYCRKNAFTPIDGGGCGEQPNYFEWTMRTGTTVDTTRPTVLATVPDSRYLADPAAFSPDNDVNRAPTLTIRLSEAIDPATINQSAADPANNTVVIRPFTTPPDPSTGLGGTTGAPIDPTTFDVAPNGANTGLEIQMVGSNLLDSFTWYEVTVQGLTDLCSNEQQPNPFRWVFETNDVAPGVASVYPTNGYAFACPNTDVQIRFSMSMYDIGSGSCAVDTNPTISGFVSEGRLTSPGGGRVFDVVPEDDFPGGSADPNRFCKRYAFRPDTALLNPNQTYQVGVNTRYQINEAGDTLNYGDLANPPSAGPWSFGVKPANECANAPRIDALDPRRGPEGQCFTIQGRYFTEPKDGADEAYFDSTDLNAASTSWSDRNIVVRAPVDSVGGHQVTVQVEHPAPIGVLTSNAANFDLDPGTFDGACLERLSPSSGTWGTRFDAYGTGFGSVAGEVSFVGSPTGAAPHASWSDIFVNDARVLDNAESGNVFITRADGRESNQILFTVSPPVPGQPRVANAWPTCGTACVNAEVGARFNMEMNPSTFTAATVELRECDPGSSSCTAYVGADLATGYTYTGAPDHELIIGHDLLAIATNYRVIIRGGASGVKSAIGGELQFAGLNFDQDGDSNADAYSWLFATKDDPTECAVASVAITPAGTTTLRIGQFRDFRGIPRGSPDSCNPAGQDLDGRAYDWTWTTTDASTVPVTSNDTTPVDGRTDPVQRATAAAATVGETITAATSGYNASATVVVSPDPTICFNNSQCITNEVGRTCDSVCLDNRCTPVVNAVAPASAPETDWVTVQGCWFGNYAAGVSRVQFAPGLDGDVPGPAACGGPAGTWKNYEVVRAVPVGAANGPLSLTRDDGRIDATDSGRGPALADFTVTVGAPGPRICQLNPTSGPVGTADTIVGDSLGTRDPGDVVTFENNQDASSYPAWANQSIQTVVPTGAETGDVVVRKGPQTSNPLTFRVTGSSGGGSCAEICAVDPDCSSGGCGSDGCCAARPTLSSYSPVGIENCRNVVITATLGGPALDTTTIHSGTVILRQAGVPVTPVSFTANPHGFTLAPPLLDPATTYDIELTDNIRTTKGVRFGGYTWSFSTGTAVCNLDHIVLSPTSHTFTRITPPGHTRGFNAYAVAANNTQIFPVPNVYNWNWGWSVSNAAVATITGSTSDTETATAVAAGDALLTATARETSPLQGFRGAKSASASLRVEACDNPWSLVDDATGTYHDTDNWAETNARRLPGGACQPYNFSLSYCRGQTGAALLPDLDEALVRCTNGDRLKEFIFKSSDPAATDAIGMLVFDNSAGLSPADWLEQNQPGESSGGQSTVVQGYPAYRLGTTTYVAATNLDTATVSCPAVSGLGNLSFESWSGGRPTDWNHSGALPQQDSPSPGGGSISVMADGSGGTGSYLSQDYFPPTPTDAHTFRIEGWVRVQRVGPSVGGAGLITQCVNPDGTPNNSDCNPSASSYDLYGNALGASGVLGNNSGWQFVRFHVSNFARFNVGLRLNCFAQPGWQAWCDNISVTHVSDGNAMLCSGGTLSQNIYILSYTEGASADTVRIFNELLRNWQLNLNPALTAEDRAAIARDTQRLSDFQRIKQRINAGIARTGRVPDLGGGTFTPNVSTSKWASWNATLGNAIGSTLPSDPVNNFDPLCTDPGFEQATCWNEAERRFQCPANSHIYGYRFYFGRCSGTGAQCAADNDCGVERCNNPAPTYTLGTNLEYIGPGTLRGPSTDLCLGLSPSACQCFTYTFNGP